ncbi:3-oxoacyl-[acyl-carrier-protein] synthase II [Pyrus ussuriensis x Pyrus communis]|uniref:beta-ketoacyl-[acyl-carrier-protein] synthase I n=1 Tax=Pyrus ussuriensis x Pyrus communis TaxID=2448454 RepID=A0A5N5I150_9ROSA|nr:3-oxoacyl-[acyl-carrier-protein] synthase II [Pyrus ussuriensis x Pyrus communis]
MPHSDDQHGLSKYYSGERFSPECLSFGWMVPNYSTSTACAKSTFCTLNSANHIIQANADLMLRGGSDSVMIPLGAVFNEIMFFGIGQNHDGFARGEGAAVLPLEELEHAKDHVVCKVVGPKSVGTFSGVILCNEKALEQSGVSREDANYINAHATSTPAGDLREYNALIHYLAMRTGWIHPNINLENADEGVVSKTIFFLQPEAVFFGLSHVGLHGQHPDFSRLLQSRSKPIFRLFVRAVPNYVGMPTAKLKFGFY